MAQHYADENFHGEAVRELRKLGHDVLTVREAGQADKKITDAEVLAFGSGLGRAVLTHNRRDFLTLHTDSSEHHGIIVCTPDQDFKALAIRIHHAIISERDLEKKLLRVNKPAKKLGGKS